MPRSRNEKNRHFLMTFNEENTAWINSIRPAFRAMVMNEIMDAIRARYPSPNDIAVTIAVTTTPTVDAVVQPTEGHG